MSRPPFAPEPSDPDTVHAEPKASADQVFDFLSEHPDFLLNQPSLLSVLELPKEDGRGAISLAQRQAQVLKDRIQKLESHTAELLRAGQENDIIIRKMTHWSRLLLLSTEVRSRLGCIVQGLQDGFSIPIVALGLWGRMIGLRFPGLAMPNNVIWCEDQDEIVGLANALIRPLCLPAHAYQARLALGLNQDEPSSSESVAIMPLRPGTGPESFGILVLASPDPSRFTQDHDVDFLITLSELASAALLGLQSTQTKQEGSV